MNDMRMAKFETMIEDINTCLRGHARKGGIDFSRGFMIHQHSDITTLALIFDYGKCNEYARVIMDSSSLCLNYENDEAAKDFWMQTFINYEAFQNAKNRLEGAKKFVQLCRKSFKSQENYKFIFWALMILTVDKTDAANHLALICDFVKMLNITEDEFEDIIQTVKLIYNELPKEYTFKSDSIPIWFASLFRMYGREDIAK